MQLHAYSTYDELSKQTAGLVADYIRQKPDALVCFASGHTPIGVFRWLVDDVKAGRLDISRCTFIGLDEWGGMNGSHEGSCRHMIDQDFFLPLDIPQQQILFFDGTSNDLQAECARINEFISASGGLDIMLVGIGLNGHLGMNEPGTPFGTYAHVSELAEDTKKVGQKYFPGETALSIGVTLGLAHFREAKLPILMASGEKKAGIVRKLLASEATELLPASIVHLAPQAVVMVDRQAYSTDS